GDLGDAAGAIHDREAEPPGDVGDRRLGLRLVEADAAAGEIVRADIAQHHIGVGYRRHGAALAVADRAGHGAGAFGTDAHRLGHLVDAHQAAAAAADRLNIDLGDEVLVLVHVADEGIGGLPLVNDADIEGGAAHVGGDDVGIA